MLRFRSLALHKNSLIIYDFCVLWKEKSLTESGINFLGM